MSIIEELPFEGDPNAPLPEQFKPKVQIQQSFSLKLLDGDGDDFSEFEQLFCRYLAEGRTQSEDKESEEVKLHELNRVRLDIEIEATRQREMERQRHQENIDTVNHSIDLMLQRGLERGLQKPLKFVGSSDDIRYFKMIFPELGEENITASKLKSIVEQCDWISAELIKVANAAEFRRVLKAAPTTEVTELGQAVNLIGAKACIVLLPKLMLERHMRNHGDFNRGVWRRLLRYQQLYSLNTYLIARHLNRPDAHLFYLLASMRLFSSYLLVNMVTSFAKEAQIASRKIALDRRDDFRISVIDEYQPSIEAMSNLLLLAEPMRDLVVDSFNLSTIPSLNILRGEEDYLDEFAILEKAKGFSQFRTLAAAKLIDKDQAQQLLKAHLMDSATLGMLQQVDYKDWNLYQLIARLNN